MADNVSLNVELLQHNAAGEKIAALAAKLCYSDSDLRGLSEKVSLSEQDEFIEKLAAMGHYSVFEHISFTFGVEGVSRALTHQLVRHRLASYSQKSQRYVKQGDSFPFIVPQTISEHPEAQKIFSEAMANIASAYTKLSQLGIPAEDARYVLPNSCETKIIITMNARELLHFFSLRSCLRAQWEIRALSDKMLALAYSVAPSIFKKAGPGCCNKGCPEGKFTCGKAALVKKHIATIKSDAAFSGEI